MLKTNALAAVLSLVISHIALAQEEETPGVTQVAPGVTQIDGSKVPSTQVTEAKIEAAIAEDNRFKSVKKLFDVKGIKNPGPAGSTTYIYKIKDPDTDANMVVILFVRDKLVLDYLVTAGAPD